MFVINSIVIQITFMLRIYLFVCGCRYELLTPNVIPKGFMDGKKAVVEMVSSWVPNPKVSLCDVDGGTEMAQSTEGLGIRLVLEPVLVSLL